MKSEILLFILVVLLSACSLSSDIIIDNFESGSYDKWTIEGDAFAKAPSQLSKRQKEWNSDAGNYLADSFGGSDELTGKLTSKEFIVTRNFINFLLGGGKHEGNYVELLVEGIQVYRSHSLANDEVLNWFSWNVKDYQGQRAVIRIVDNEYGGWGHLMVDEFRQSNKAKAIALVNYEMNFQAIEKFVLIPVEDECPETEIQLLVNGEKVGEPVHIRIAQNKIDYWVPLNIAKYKDEQISLIFSLIQKSDIVFKEIKQADKFEYEINEKYRPIYHPTPAQGWMNDSNGMVYHSGEYHLFFQHNPYGSRWANMHWGHFVSKDLTSWEQLPDALAPDSLGAIFSGSAVIDKDNTAGFGKNALVAIYTSAGKLQTQSIAYSIDNGRTFTKYENNPVLSDPTIADFRDPKVIWHAMSKQWVMVLATQQTITFYGSKNLKEWNKLSEFGQVIGAHGGVWECPDLFELKSPEGKSKWILLVSINPGLSGGSATQYFIGSFDGKTFSADSLPYPLWLDYGRDNYAGVSWSNIPETDGRRIFIGWMSNWDYSNHAPQLNFKNSMTVPRELKLAHNSQHLVVASWPVVEMESLRNKETLIDSIKVKEFQQVENLFNGHKGAFEILMSIQTNESKKFSFSLVNEKGEELLFAFDKNDASFRVDRSKCGIANFEPRFANQSSYAPIEIKDRYEIRLLIDKSSAECFIDGGKTVQTNTIFPTGLFNSLVFRSDDMLMIDTIKVYELTQK